jgi:hypothetical protein
LVGGIVDAIMYHPDQIGMESVREIYIDPMTGEYDFSDIDFSKI